MSILKETTLIPVSLFFVEGVSSDNIYKSFIKYDDGEKELVLAHRNKERLIKKLISYNSILLTEIILQANLFLLMMLP